MEKQRSKTWRVNFHPVHRIRMAVAGIKVVMREKTSLRTPVHLTSTDSPGGRGAFIQAALSFLYVCNPGRVPLALNWKST
jgi:hypothetical protein